MNGRTQPGRWVTATILLFALAMGARADEEKKATIDELRSPTSPAFTILGVAPTNVVRPNTPRELAVELLSAQEQGGGDLPSDLALEVSPYWLVDHPNLTYSDYYANKNIGTTILRSLSLSVATADIPDEAVDGTTLGVGVRFLLFAGNKAPEMDEKVASLKKIQLDFLECVPDIPDTPGGEETSPCSAAEMAALEEQMGNANSEIGSLERTGWVVEAAFAASRDYPDAEGAPSHDRQVGAWLTASYKIRDPSELSMLAAARLLEDRTGIDKVRMTDIGGRLIYESSGLPVSLSIEVMHRDIEDGDSSTSVLGVLEYPINDMLRLVASYGKGLPTPTNDSDLQATISLNFGFGKGPSVAFDNLH